MVGLAPWWASHRGGPRTVVGLVPWWASHGDGEIAEPSNTVLSLAPWANPRAARFACAPLALCQWL